jgi:hypothetical protein
LEAEGFTIEKGQFKDTTTVSGHTMLYQSFTAESVGVITFQGVSGVWYCDRSRRSFEFTLMVMQGEEESLLRFNQYTGSFTCD